jgi:putative ABC transport system permease protein
LFFIIKLSWRNLFRHRGKSLIIGMILLFAAFFMTMGNGVINGMEAGLYRNLGGSFLGDIALLSTNQEAEDLFFDNLSSIEPISSYTNIKTFLEKRSGILSFMPMAIGASSIIEEDHPVDCLLLGVKFEDYQAFFGSNVIITEGRELKNNGSEGGIIFSGRWRDHIYEKTGYWISPAGYPVSNTFKNSLIKTNLVFMGYSKDMGNDIRLPVRGIMHYKDYNYNWGYFSIMDIESFRNCFNLITGSDSVSNVSAEDKKLLDTSDAGFDSSFSSVVTSSPGDASSQVNYEFLKGLRSRKTTNAGPADADSGTYNYISLKIKKGDQSRIIKSLNEDLAREKLDAKAVPWQKISGQLYDGTNIFKNIISVFVFFLFFVVIIVIMNTLNMSVMERAGEIAMMRSIGARKSLVASIFYYETILLTIAFGGAGIIAGVFAVNIISGLNITITAGEVAPTFFASDHFRPFVGPAGIAVSTLELLVFLMLSVVLPARLAMKVKPLEAFSKE